MLGALLSIQTVSPPAKPVRDPVLHRAWTTVAGGGGKMHLRLNPDGTFAMSFRADREKKSLTTKGTFRKVAAPAQVLAMFKGSSMIHLSVSLATARKMGMDAEEAARLKKAGTTSVVSQKFVYDPSVPILSDIMTVHLAPVGEEAGVLARLKKSEGTGRPW